MAAEKGQASYLSRYNTRYLVIKHRVSAAKHMSFSMEQDGDYK